MLVPSAQLVHAGLHALSGWTLKVTFFLGACVRACFCALKRCASIRLRKWLSFQKGRLMGARSFFPSDSNRGATVRPEFRISSKSTA